MKSFSFSELKEWAQNVAVSRYIEYAQTSLIKNKIIIDFEGWTFEERGNRVI